MKKYISIIMIALVLTFSMVGCTGMQFDNSASWYGSTQRETFIQRNNTWDYRAKRSFIIHNKYKRYRGSSYGR